MVYTSCQGDVTRAVQFTTNILTSLFKIRINITRTLQVEVCSLHIPFMQFDVTRAN